jgi:hypothetical protein
LDGGLSAAVPEKILILLLHVPLHNVCPFLQPDYRSISRSAAKGYNRIIVLDLNSIELIMTQKIPAEYNKNVSRCRPLATEMR